MKKIILFLLLIGCSFFISVNSIFVEAQPMPPDRSSGTATTGKVTVTWETKTVSVCPPAIFGLSPCNFPSLEDLVNKIAELLQAVAAPALVLLLIIGGLMYLLTPFGVESFIKKGHNYIKYAILGFVILLLVTLIFSTISAILGGPGS
jgi:hypothetical protein